MLCEALRGLPKLVGEMLIHAWLERCGGGLEVRTRGGGAARDIRDCGEASVLTSVSALWRGMWWRLGARGGVRGWRGRIGERRGLICQARRCVGRAEGPSDIN